MGNVKIYTTKEVAKMLKVSDATVRRETDRGKLKSFKVGIENRYTQYHIDEYTRLKELGKTERELALEGMIEELNLKIQEKEDLILNIKDMLLKA